MNLKKVRERKVKEEFEMARKVFKKAVP